ncbi:MULTISPECIES: anti-sigma factor [unclassified Exiguobacterium]|uniref:anti-sigma factor n=1 Tax=unclassified Exiguobacterium TaxID=2644629 RepID=UPI001BEC29EA|nr:MULTISPECIES: anti-sigma factor [unclassified Exiguobacterium]
MNACDQLIDYFNQHLSEDERAKFEQHLASCKDCQEELEQLEALVGGVAFLSTPIEPPRGMKARVLDRVFEEDNEPITSTVSPAAVPPATPFKQKKKRNVSVLGMVALAAALLLSLIGNGYLLTNQPDAPGIALNETIPLDGESEGTAYLAEQDGTTQLIVQTNGLSSLDANEVYQVWLLKDGAPIPTGAFVTDDKGNGTVIYTLDSDEVEVDWDTVAVTKEPNRGNETPQGEMVLNASL